MKKLLTLSVTALIVISFFIFKNYYVQPEHKIVIKQNKEFSAGTKDNPNARRDYEFMMLRDPATNRIPQNIYNLEQAFASRLPKSGESDNANSLVWSERGPNNVGGRTRALAPDVTNANIIIAGGVSGGIWRSTNFGQSWIQTTTNSQLHSATCIAQDTRVGKTSTWYVGTGEKTGNSAGMNNNYFFGNGLFKSTNSGLNWNLIPSTSGIPPTSFSSDWQFVWNVVTDPSNASQDIVYAATFGGIYRSSNAGDNWNQVLGAGAANSEFTDIVLAPAGVVYAAGSFIAGGTMNGIRRSTDGISYTDITPPSYPPQYGRTVLAIAPSNPNVLYVAIQGTPTGVNEHQFWKYTYISGNGTGTGGIWENRSSNLPQANQGNLGIGNEPFNSQGGYDFFMKVKPDDQNFVLLHAANMYRSTDGFASTANTRIIGGYLPVYTTQDSANNTYPNHHPDVHSGFFKNGSTVQFVSGHDGGISVTNDITSNIAFNKPVTWTSLNNGYNVTQFYGISIAPESGSNKLAGGFQDNGSFMTVSGSLPVAWTELSSGDGCFIEIAPAADNRVYPSYQNGGLYRKNYNPEDSIIEIKPYLSKKPLFVNPFALDKNNSSIMYFAGGRTTDSTGIWRNTNVKLADTSSGWSYIAGTSFGNSDAQVSAIGVSKANSTYVVYYGTTKGNIKRIDNSNTATPVVSAYLEDTTYMPKANISCIAVDPTNSAKVIAVYSNYNVMSVWYTTNSGANWANQEGNLYGTNGPSIRWAEIFYVSGIMHVVLSTSTGIYYTSNIDGINTVWTQEGVNSIGNVVCVMSQFRDSDKTLVIATHGRGAFQSQVTVPISVGQISTEVPSAYSLSQNYPNPFNPTTVIRFGIPSFEGYAQRGVGMVQLKIFDITGREIATLINEKLAPGTYSVTWNASNFATGVYFYKLTTDTYTSTKKMVLIK